MIIGLKRLLFFDQKFGKLLDNCVFLVQIRKNFLNFGKFHQILDITKLEK